MASQGQSNTGQMGRLGNRQFSGVTSGMIKPVTQGMADNSLVTQLTNMGNNPGVSYQQPQDNMVNANPMSSGGNGKAPSSNPSNSTWTGTSGRAYQTGASGHNQAINNQAMNTGPMGGDIRSGTGLNALGGRGETNLNELIKNRQAALKSGNVDAVLQKLTPQELQTFGTDPNSTYNPIPMNLYDMNVSPQQRQQNMQKIQQYTNKQNSWGF